MRVFAHYRVWYDELRRELRLLALNHGDDYPVSQEISEITLRVEQERRQARGVDRLDAAIRAGADRADLRYDVPASAPATMMAGCASCSRRSTSSAASSGCSPLEPTAQQVQLRQWYLGEFERQGRGEPPTAVARAATWSTPHPREAGSRSDRRSSARSRSAVPRARCCARPDGGVPGPGRRLPVDDLRGQRRRLPASSRCCRRSPVVRRRAVLPAAARHRRARRVHHAVDVLRAGPGPGRARPRRRWRRRTSSGTLAACLLAVAVADRFSTAAARADFDGEEGDQ